MSAVCRIEVLALDIDGVLTDGTLDPARAEEPRRVSFQDLDAVGRARAGGLRVALVTAEGGRSVAELARRFGIDMVMSGAKDKLAALQGLARSLDLPLASFCYVGDGDRDALAIEAVGFGIAPANGTPAAKRAARLVLSRSGGTGAVAEALDALVRRDRSRPFEAVAREAASRRLGDADAPWEAIAAVAAAIRATLEGGFKIVVVGESGADSEAAAAEAVLRFRATARCWPAIGLPLQGSTHLDGETIASQAAAVLRAGDVAVALVPSGAADRVRGSLLAARELGAVTACITRAAGGPVDEHADLRVHAGVGGDARRIGALTWLAILDAADGSTMLAPDLGAAR